MGFLEILGEVLKFGGGLLGINCPKCGSTNIIEEDLFENLFSEDDSKKKSTQRWECLDCGYRWTGIK